MAIAIVLSLIAVATSCGSSADQDAGTGASGGPIACDARNAVPVRSDPSLVVADSSGSAWELPSGSSIFRRLPPLGLHGWLSLAGGPDGIVWAVDEDDQVAQIDLVRSTVRTTHLTAAGSTDERRLPADPVATSDGMIVTRLRSTTVEHLASGDLSSRTIDVPELADLEHGAVLVAGAGDDFWAVAPYGEGPVLHVTDGAVDLTSPTSKTAKPVDGIASTQCLWSSTAESDHCRPGVAARRPDQEEPVWSERLHDECLAQVSLIDGIVWVATSGGDVTRIDPATGEQTVTEDVFECGDGAFVAGGPGHVVAFDDCDVAAAVLDPATGAVQDRVDFVDRFAEPMDAIFQVRWPWVVTEAQVFLGTDLDAPAVPLPTAGDPSASTWVAAA